MDIILARFTVNLIYVEQSLFTRVQRNCSKIAEWSLPHVLGVFVPRICTGLNTNTIIARPNEINLWECKLLWALKRKSWISSNRMFLVQDVMHESSSSGLGVRARRRERERERSHLSQLLLLTVPKGFGYIWPMKQLARKFHANTCLSLALN